MTHQRRYDPSTATGWEAARARWNGFSPLAREVTVVIVVKACVLGLLWWAFFRDPVAPHMTLDPKTVEERVLLPPTPSEAPNAHR